MPSQVFLKYYDNNNKKSRAGQLSRQAKPVGDTEKIRLEGLERSESKAMEEPMAPDTPFVNER